jgi:glycosyltransferase involved in cell wall biosynthesis
VPWPQNDGGNIAMLNMAELLLEAGHQVTIFALNTSKHFIEPADLPARFRNNFNIHTAPIDTKVTLTGAVRNLFRSEESYNIVRFYSQTVEHTLVELLHHNQFDVIQLESLFTTPYIDCIRRNSSARIILRSHNTEFRIWERLARTEKNPFRQSYYHFLAKRLRHYELGILHKIDGILPITTIDQEVFTNAAPSLPVFVMPLGINLKEYPHPDTKADEPLKIFHLGSMDWLPNLEGIRWFLQSCWPSIHAQFPSLPLYLAGRGFPEDIIQSAPAGVHCSTVVKDANEYMKDKQVMIVPLLSGSGLRVKILQGLAMGKTIISTTIGAEGIDVTDGTNILLADTPNDYLKQIEWCITNPEKCRMIGQEGRKLIVEKYSNEVLAQQLQEFIKGTLA